MEENIIDKITEAERIAEERKAVAQARAGEILAEAESKALGLTAQAEEALKELRARCLAEAGRRAEVDYQAALSERQAEAEAYADGLLEHTDVYVAEIVGRIVK